ncbi:hypothetical protein JXA84_00775 [candidate division WOR-3 bacterium]|nr:hypothetical protein [candidate division WOR-3 bacterium]
MIIAVLGSPLIAGIYGMLHDQFTYTVSREYYTKFKFIQLGLTKNGETLTYPERLGVAKVGFLATWWTGIPIGVLLRFTGLVHRNRGEMLKYIFFSAILVFLITV